MPLLKLLEQDLKTWLNSPHNRLLFNEQDFQLQLAQWLLSTKNYDHVELEYYVPANILPRYNWVNPRNGNLQELYLDIVVERDKKFAIVELKYTTREIAKQLSRFNQVIPSAKIIKYQGADDLVKYAFWKDVRRIELVNSTFKDVVGGFALMITNDPIYQKPSKPNTLKVDFGMEDGVHSPQKHWPRITNTNKNLPNFDLNKSYTIKWYPIQFDNENFNYTLIKI